MIAALLTERGLGGFDTDLTHRLSQFANDRSPRARDARRLAERWGRGETTASDGLLLARAYPERIAKARGKSGEYLLASGRGAYLEPTDALARQTWLAVGELGGGAARDRILLAAALDEADLAAFEDQTIVEDVVEADDKGRVRARRIKRLGRLVLEERLIDRPDAAVIERALAAELARAGLPWGERSATLRARLGFAGIDLPDEASLLEALVSGKTALGQIGDAELEAALRALVPWDAVRRLDTEAPARFTAPTGNTFAIDYAAEGGPRVEVRVGELYGLSAHPAVGGQPLTLALLSPAHRPIQTTKDLPGFWKGSWADVRKDMRGRYPKHVWPEDPAAAAPVTRAKPRA